MATQDQSQQKSKPSREKQQRRVWTSKEEEALLEAMLEVFDETYRADNGFRSGFYGKVEVELKKLLPGTTLKANPNIDSKVKGWKEKYALLTDMIKLSGFAWNFERNCIEVDDVGVWEAYEKSHKGVKGMNGKSFPMYESWGILFGKDRATGEMAEDAPEAQESNAGQTPVFDDMFNDCYSPCFANGEPMFGTTRNFDTSMGDGGANPTPQGPNYNPSTPTSVNGMPERAKKKAKVSPETEAMTEAVKGFMAHSNVVLEKIADTLGYDYDKQLSEKRTSVYVELEKLDMDDFQRFRLNNIIIAKEERVDAFFGIPEHLKQRWAEGILEGTIPF